MPARNPLPLPTEAARSALSEIYRTADWRALTEMVDRLIGEVKQQQDRIAALEARDTF
jgi:hypothetical protein